jgi:hypothetical protein
VAQRDRFSWQMSLYAVVVAVLVMLLSFVYASDPVLDYLFFLVPTVSFAIFALLLVLVFSKRTWRTLSMLLAAVTFLFVAGAMLKTQEVVRPILRWTLWSHRYKSDLLAQPAPAIGQLKHLEWESSGWGPIGPTIVYLVLDPDDSLSAAAKSHRPGRFSGIPCEVPRVQRLESHWYAVTFYTEESWSEGNRLNCSGSGG